MGITADMLAVARLEVGRSSRRSITVSAARRPQISPRVPDVVHRAQPDPDPDARPAAAPDRRGVRAAGRRRPDRAAAGRLPRRGAARAGRRDRGRADDGITPRPRGCAARGSSCRTRAWAPPRRCCCPRCWPRAGPCCATPPPSPRSSSWPCSCSGWAPASSCRPDRGSSSRACDRLRGAPDLAGRRPHRGVQLPGGRPDHRGRGAGARLPAGPAGHRDHHAGHGWARSSTSPTSGSPRRRRDGLRPAAVQTDTHPGFMTDWQTPLMVLFTQADGMSVLHETVFEDRLVYVPALKKMGCEIELFATCLGGAGVPLPRHQRRALGGRQGRVQAARRRRRRCPTCGPGSPPCSPRPSPTGPRRCAASTTSSAATTGRSSSSPSLGLDHPARLRPGLIPNGLAILPL